jgi:hypothetical protein
MMKLPASSGPLLATYLAFIGLSILILVLARGFPAADMGAAGPGFFPQVVAVLLFLPELRSCGGARPGASMSRCGSGRVWQ